MNDLILIEKKDLMSVFTKRDCITPLLDKIKQAATQELFDVTNDKGRKAIASMAYRVAQSKTYIESHGKNLAAELKELPKMVDSNRKYARDFLDNLKEQVRKPLDDWEAEQAAILLSAKVLLDHAEAIICNTDWDLAVKAENDRIAKERLDYEAKVFADAKIKAKIEADEKARREIIDAEARALSAELEISRLQEQATRDIAQATQKATQDAKLLQEKEEESRQAQERLNEYAKQKKDNVNKVKQSIIDDFLAIGLNDKQAKYILDAILDNKIKGLKVIY